MREEELLKNLSKIIRSLGGECAHTYCSEPATILSYCDAHQKFREERRRRKKREAATTEAV